MEKISISIVTYNNELEIGALLSSLVKVNLERIDRIHFIDNASTDNTVKLIKSFMGKWQNIELLVLDTNIGFGNAHNTCIEKLTSSIHIFCNPDIIFSDVNLFDKIFECFPANAGAIVPKFYYLNGELQALNKRYPNVFDLFLRRVRISVIHKLFRTRMNSYEMRDIGYDTSYDVEAVSGAFLICSTQLLKRIGGFDSSYFLYFEDVDLGRKIQREGFRTVYCPDISVVHKWERGAHKSLKLMNLFIKSGFIYFRKWGWKLY